MKQVLMAVVLCGVIVAGDCFADDSCCAVAEKDPSVWDRSVALGFNYTEGNSNTLLLNLNAKAARDYESNIWSFELDGNYGENDDNADEEGDTITHEDLRAKASYKRLLSDRFYVGFGPEFFYDEIAKVDYRVKLNPFVGFFLVREDRFRFSVETGPSYVFEKLDGVKDDYLAPRVGQRLEWDISETAKLYEEAEYLLNIDDSDNYLVHAEAGIEAVLTSMLSLVLKVVDDYDNVPAADKERNDLAVISALQLTI